MRKLRLRKVPKVRSCKWWSWDSNQGLTGSQAWVLRHYPTLLPSPALGNSCSVCCPWAQPCPGRQLGSCSVWVTSQPLFQIRQTWTGDRGLVVGHCPLTLSFHGLSWASFSCPQLGLCLQLPSWELPLWSFYFSSPPPVIHSTNILWGLLCLRSICVEFQGFSEPLKITCKMFCIREST